MKDSHIITGFVVLGAAVINLYLSPPASRSSQSADAAAAATTASVSETFAGGTDCEGATSVLVPAVAPPCPVMKMKVTTKDYKSTYQGKTYYFCCPDCKPKFDRDPPQYLL